VRLAFGLGAEKLGVMTLRHPLPVLIVIMSLTVILGFALLRLQFEGDVMRLVDQRTQSWADYQTISSDFPGAMPDLFVLASSDTKPPSQQWLGRLQDLQLDLQLVSGVASVQSVFSLRQPDGSGGSRPVLNPFDDLMAEGDLISLTRSNPMVPLFLRPGQGLALLSLSLRDAHGTETAELTRTIAEISDLVARSGIEAEVSGRSAAQIETSAVIQRDLLKMVGLSILVGWIVGLLIFSDIRAVLITNLVAPAAMIWTAGVYGAIGVPLDSATVILPLLAAIIAFADAVHIVVPLQHRIQSGQAIRDALSGVIGDVGPATALTSMTTAVAFGSLAFAGGGLVNMAIMGVVAVVLAWVSVMTLCPLLCLVLARRGLGEMRLASVMVSRRFWAFAHVCIAYRWPVAISALALCSGLVVTQTQFRSIHQPTSYFPAESAFLQADRNLSAAFSGSSTILVRVPLAQVGDPSHVENLERISQWHDAIAAVTDDGAVWSRALLDQDLIASLPDDAADISPDAAHALIAIRHQWGASDEDVGALKDRIGSAVALLPGGNAALVSGVTLVISEGARDNIDQLRAGLFLSVLLAACLVAVASSSLSAGAGTGLAVLLCVLLVLTFGSMPHGLVNYGLVVALIISAGIAIDDGIHLINYARHSPYFETSQPKAYAQAVEQAGAAIVFSSVILIASMSVTQFAEMPAIRSIGREIIAALCVALVLTLTVVPAVALAVRDLLNLGNTRGRDTND
jgi:predicted RND superfamily exporter protein